MLVVSEVLTTIDPSGLTATPSGSTPTGNSLTTLRVAMSIAVNSASFSLATNTSFPSGLTRNCSGSGPDGSSPTFFRVLVSMTAIVSSSPSADEHQRVVLAQRDAARALADLDGPRHLELVEVDDRDRIALLVGDVGGRRLARPESGAKAARRRARRRARQAFQWSLHLVSGWSKPSVSSSDTWCRKPSCGETETVPRPSVSRIGWRSCWFQSRNGEPLALEVGDLEVRRQQIVVHRLGVGGFGPRDRVADHPHGDPGLVVARGHAALEHALEAVLQLHGAPQFVRGVPARRPQARGADDRARVPGAVGQVAGEHLVLVGRDEHVVIGRLLGEDRHLPLDLDAAGVRAPAAASVLETRSSTIFAPNFFAARSISLAPALGPPDASRPRGASVSTASRSDIARARRPASNASARCG